MAEKKISPNEARNMLRLMEEERQKPAHVVLLDFGRKAGIQDASGKIIAVWPVSRPESE